MTNLKYEMLKHLGKDVRNILQDIRIGKNFVMECQQQKNLTQVLIDETT